MDIFARVVIYYPITNYSIDRPTVIYVLCELFLGSYVHSLWGIKNRIFLIKLPFHVDVINP